MAGPALGKLINIGSSDDESATDSIVGKLRPCGSIREEADPLVGKLIDIGSSDDEIGLPQNLQETIMSVDKNLGRYNDTELPRFLDTRCLTPKFKLATAEPNIDMSLIENEKFDFDLSSSSTNSANDDEVFFGPVSHKEKCVATANLLDLDLIDDKNSCDTLTAKQMSQVVVEASKIVAKLSQQTRQKKDEENKTNVAKVDKNCNVIEDSCEPEVDDLISAETTTQPAVKRRCANSSSDAQSSDTSLSDAGKPESKLPASKLRKPCIKKPAMKNYSKSTLKVRFGKSGKTSMESNKVSNVLKTDENENIEKDISSVNISHPHVISDDQSINDCKTALGPSNLVLKPALSFPNSSNLQRKPGASNRTKTSDVVKKSGPLKALPPRNYNSASDTEHKSTEIIQNIPKLEEMKQLPAPSSAQMHLQRASFGTPVQLQLSNSTNKNKGSGRSSLVINKYRLSSSSATSDCSPAVKSRASMGIPRQLRTPGSTCKATPSKQCKSALPKRTLSSSSATSDASPVVKTRSFPVSYANKPATPSVGSRGRSSIATPNTGSKRKMPSSAYMTRSKQRMSSGSVVGIDTMTDSVLIRSSVSSNDFLAYESHGSSTSSQNSSFGFGLPVRRR